MALPDNLYVAFQGLQTYFVDRLTGDPLSAGYVEFYSDVARSVPKDVFQQVQLPDGTYDFVNIGSIITLSAVGTFQSPNDNTDIQVYAYPYDILGEVELYFLRVYSVDASLQFTREAQPPNVADGGLFNSFETSDNQIENPQFVETFLPPSLTKVFDVTGAATETFIAPDWSVITNGTGTVTVTQEPLTNITMPTGAPFAINISSTGVTGVTLRQRITQSPRILGEGFIFGSLVAKSFTAAAIPIVMNYVASNGYTVNLMTQSTLADGSYSTLSDGVSQLVSTTNTNSPNTPGYVDIDIVIPALASVGITSVQIIHTGNANSVSQFIQQSTPRQIDHLFHYYKPQLEYKPIPSLLTGWDFPLNPAQFAGSTVAATAIGANKSKYVWDQTIIFQSANSGVGVTRGASGALVLTAAVDTQMAVIQYLGATQARKALNDAIATNLAAYASAAAGVRVTISLWYTTDASLPNIAGGTNNSLVLSLDADGKPATFNGTWSEVPRIGNQGDAIFTVAQKVDENFPDYMVNGWDLEGIAAVNTATFFAIVIGTASMTGADTLSIYSVGMCAGDIATRPAPQTPDQVLGECEYYYEKSYPTASIPGAVTYEGSLLILQGDEYISAVIGHTWSRAPLSLLFKTEKRIAPASSGIVLYSPTSATPAQVLYTVYNGASPAASGGGNTFTPSPAQTVLASTQWNVTHSSTKAITFLNNLTTAVVTETSALVPFADLCSAVELQYTIDCRLGIV